MLIHNQPIWPSGSQQARREPMVDRQQTVPWTGGLISSTALTRTTRQDKGPSGGWTWGLTTRVQRIVIVNTRDGGGYDRLTNFVLSVGLTLDNLSPCGPEYTGVVGAGASVNITCNRIGRFVKFRKLGGEEVHIVTLCEVEVYGTVAYDCNLCLSGMSCSADDGCRECHPGKRPPACIHECNPGTHSVNCSSSCGRCRSPPDCAPENGVCSQGCQLWWAGDRCDVNIVRPDRTTETARISDVTNSSLEVTWQQITSIPRDYRQYYRYTISYRVDYDIISTVGPTVEHVNSEENQNVRITGLEYYQKYHVRIIPYREMDGQKESGVIYPNVSRYTACGYPDSPTDFRALSFTENDREKIRILWKDVRGDTVLSRCAGGTYQVRVMLVNTEGLTTASDVQTVAIQAPTVPTTNAPSYTPSYTDGNPAVDITSIVIAVVIIVVAAVTAIVITVLILRQRKAQHARKDAHDKELHTYENQSVSSTGQHQPPNQPSDLVDYEEVPAPVEAQYQGMDATTRERPTSDDAYTTCRIPGVGVEEAVQVEEQYQEIDVTSREPQHGNEDYAKIRIDG